MSDSVRSRPVGDHDGSEIGRISWRRCALVGLPSVAALGALLGMLANGSLATSFAVSGQSFKISASSLDGQGMQQFPAADREANGRWHPVNVTVIRSARIRDLCQSVRVGLPGGSVVLRMTAGEGTAPVTAEGMVVDPEQLSGDAVFTGYASGVDAARLSQVPAKRGTAGMFGQQANTVRITGLRQVAWSTSAGTFRLPGLRMHVGGSTRECF